MFKVNKFMKLNSSKLFIENIKAVSVFNEVKISQNKAILISKTFLKVKTNKKKFSV